MIIPLAFHGTKGNEMVSATCRVLLPHVSGQISFQVDTGSPLTFIGAVDIERLGIAIKKPASDDLVQWADKHLRMSKTHGIVMYFRSEEDGKEKLKTISMPGINATIDFIRTKEGMDSPSIMGLDFLINHSLKLFVDGRNKKAWLED